VAAEAERVQLSPLRMAAVATAVPLAIVCLVVVDPFSSALVGAAGCAVLVAVTVTDLERRIVPNRIVVPALIATLIARTALDPSPRWALAALAVGGILFALAVVYPAGLGMGDVKLAAFLGGWLGWTALVALAIGTFASFLPAIAILVRRGRAGRKVGLPFAPFLALGGVVALLWGDRIWDWYSSLGS
jgi:leader peptidase (prepilin peptidase) / N-methyltransferase